MDYCNLKDNKLTDPIPESISKLKVLRKFNLNGNAFSGTKETREAAIRKLLPGCKTVKTDQKQEELSPR